MSLRKYIDNKTESNILIVMDEYKEKLEADIASFILKPHYKNNINKYVINISEISKILSELNYPYADKFKIAISTINAKKINSAYKEFVDWSSLNNNHLIFKVKNEIFKYQKKIYTKELNAENVNEIVQSLLFESKLIIDQMAHNIEMAISKIPGWNNKIVLEAINANDDFLVSEVKVTIGDLVTSSFIYENFLNEFNIKNIEETSDNLELLKQKLILKLMQNSKYNNILTLYMNRPLSERKIYELIKRDLSLGIKSVLPEHIFLTNNLIINEFDTWKVRVDRQYLVEHIVNENTKKYNSIKDIPIRWIERVINEE